MRKSDDETTAHDIASKFAGNRFIDELERAIMAYGSDWARAARNAALEEAAKVADAAMLEAEDAMSDGLGAALLERTAAAIRALKGAP